MKTRENIMERAETKIIPISDLKLDSENVRLKHIKPSMSEAEIEDYFWKEPQTTELYAQIKAARGLLQEPIVTINGVVKEGNRRLVCLRMLGREAHAGKLPGMPATQFDRIKCSVIPRDASDSEILMLLAIIHVRGKKAWDAFNKAETLASLHWEHKKSYDTISRELGMAKVTIIRTINAHEAIKKYNEKYPDDSDWYRNFTCFDELFRRRALKVWRENPSSMLDFFLWIHEGKISSFKQVRRLDKILNNEHSRKIFDEKGFIAAMDYLNTVDPTIQDSSFRSISNTIKTLQGFDRRTLIQIIGDPSRIRILQNLRQEINSLLTDIAALDRTGKRREGEVIEEKEE